MKKRMIGIVSLLALICSYLLVRYPLFDLHRMKDWSLTLLIPGVIAVVISGVVFGKKFLPIFTAAGYISGFFGGYLLQSTYYDPNSGTYPNNMWVIWTVSYLAVIAAGIIVEIICGIVNKKQGTAL